MTKNEFQNLTVLPTRNNNLLYIAIGMPDGSWFSSLYITINTTIEYGGFLNVY
jgi:hypothetical protein